MPKSQPLEYKPATPAFLQRLKANNLALDGRHNVQIPRARGGAGGPNDRLNMKGEDGEDEPIVVDEDGNVVSKEEMESMQKGDGEVEGKDGSSEQVEDGDMQRKADVDDGREKEAEKVSSGFGKKRKVGKVIMDGEGEDSSTKEKDVKDNGEPVKSLEESTNDLKSVVGKGKEGAKKEEIGKKTKRKKIKLSFDEPE